MSSYSCGGYSAAVPEKAYVFQSRACDHGNGVFIVVIHDHSCTRTTCPDLCLILLRPTGACMSSAVAEAERSRIPRLVAGER